MAEDTPLDDRFDLRINSTDKQDFIKTCEKLKQPPQSTLRQIIKAFNGRRLRIKMPDKTLKLMQEIFNDH